MLPSTRIPSLLVLWAGALLCCPIPGHSQSPSVLSLLPAEEDVLDVGDERTGALSASDYRSPTDAYLDAWELNGQAGASVTVDLRSDDFDAMLWVVGPGLGETLHDDDGGGGCHSRITFTFLDSGTFRVIVGSVTPGATGTYTLRTATRAEPAPSHGCGEPNPAQLAELPTEDRTLSMGSIGTGSFDFVTPSLEGRPVEAWTLHATAGEPLSIVLEADAFDSYLYLLGPGIEGALADDDGAGDLNSRIELTPSSDGPFTVVASALSDGATGAYTLRVEEPVDLATLETVGSVRVGETIEGVLGTSDPIVADGRYGQVWALEGDAGTRVTIELISDAFDAFLYVAGPGLSEVLTDDDGAGDLNSRISFTLPESGRYRVIVSALDADVNGSFTLGVTTR